MANDRIRLDLELDIDSEPITGELSVPGAGPIRFTGYTGLIVAVGRLFEPGTVEATDSSIPDLGVER